MQGMRSERELRYEHKRVRGEISCAECRRLKQKCDKKIPCSTCVRRGCESVCPLGTIPPKKGAVAKSDTDIRFKLIQMSKRIRQLEDALKVLQSRVSSEPHPLLAKECLEIKKLTLPEETPESTDVDALSDFGSLVIADEGMMRFVKRFELKTMLLPTLSDYTQGVERRALQNVPAEIARLSVTFPFSPFCQSKDRAIALLVSHLPPYHRATALSEAYLQHVSFCFCPIGREQIMEELLPKFYHRRGNQHPLGNDPEITEHQLALLFGMFACGAAEDLTLPPHNDEGETYWQFARGALSLHSVFDGTSVATVQAVAILGAYDLCSSGVHTVDSAFKLLSLALCLGVSIGLHWDPAGSNIEPKLVQRRRSLLWELYEMDVYKCLASGKPTILHMDEIGCKFPSDAYGAKDIKFGAKSYSYWGWKIEYTSKVTSKVADRLSAAGPLKYSDILELDRRVRDYRDGTQIDSPTPDDRTSESALYHLLQLLRSEAMLFFIHRNFFIVSLRENARDPFQSKFASSFIATYSSAVAILRAIWKEFDHHQYLLLRRWTVWVLAFGCAVVVGSIAATKMDSDLSKTALEELDIAIQLFEKASSHPVTRNGLPTLFRLQSRARRNLASIGDINDDSPASVKNEEVDEALALIGGTARPLGEEERRSTETGHPEAHLFLSRDHYSAPEGIETTNGVAHTGSLHLAGPPQGHDMAWLDISDQVVLDEYDSRFDVGRVQSGGHTHQLYPETLPMHRPSEINAMLMEDTLRKILEDPHFSYAGVNGPTFNF